MLGFPQPIRNFHNPQKMRKAIQQIERANQTSLDDISFYIGNIESKVDIEKLKKEQEVQELSLQELDQLILEADFTEDIDELLETLNC